MSSVDALRWLTGTAPVDWPTTSLDISANGVGVTAVRVPERWATTDDSVPGSVRWRGVVPGEGMVISHLSDAEPGHDLTTWVAADQMVGGGSNPLLTPPGADTTILEWIGQLDDPEIDARFDVEESRAFVGVVQMHLDTAELLRAYTLVLRRGRLAWKVTLHLSTACLPGSPDDMVDRNDHARARAIFGAIELASS